MARGCREGVLRPIATLAREKTFFGESEGEERGAGRLSSCSP